MQNCVCEYIRTRCIPDDSSSADNNAVKQSSEGKRQIKDVFLKEGIWCIIKSKQLHRLN